MENIFTFVGENSGIEQQKEKVAAIFFFFYFELLHITMKTLI